MKIILILLIVLSSQIFSQNSESSFYSLKQQAISEISQMEDLNHSFLIDDVQKKKSSGLAIVYSLLLPGMGELYADAYDSGIYFTVADGALWGSYIGINVYANWQKDRYITYAQTNGGITTANKDDNYYATIGQYLNIVDYNNEKAFERNFDEMYNSNTYFWKWNSNEERKSYRDMWVTSEQSFNNLRFVVGALVLNRVVSAINAVRLVSKYNNKLKEEVGWNVSVGVQNYPDNTSGYKINFITSF
ncbi:MAG TPA: hypothetical protein PL018_07475 [Ignavibacteriaceae bacterium]|nr:hypothetical protein [Ignavibacteriaceae bacterium]